MPLEGSDSPVDPILIRSLLHVGPALALALALATSCSSVQKRAAGERTAPVWLLTVDNDSYSFDDGNYTNGISLAWLSPKVALTESDSVSRWVASASAWLPGLDEAADTFVGFSGGQLIFTPESLLDDNPPIDERPYAGIVFFDTSITTVDGPALASWNLRLGVVGEPSMAEEVQTELHEWFGADDPQGWKHQLRDEPLINISYERRHCVLAGSTAGGLAYDITPRAGASLGNYLTGLTTGVRVRFGESLPRDVGSPTMRTSFEPLPTMHDTPGPTLGVFGFVDVDVNAIAHYLPIDGNVFVDGRGVESKNWVASGSTGLTLTHGDFALTLAFTVLTDAYDAQDETGQYGTISLAWFR